MSLKVLKRRMAHVVGRPSDMGISIMSERLAKFDRWQGRGLGGRLVGRVMAPEAWKLVEIGKGEGPAEVHSIPHSADLALI